MQDGCANLSSRRAQWSSRDRGRNAGTEGLLHQPRVDAAGGTNGYDLRPRGTLTPVFLERDVDAPADHLQHRSTMRRVGVVDHPFGSIDRSRQLPQRLAQRFQSEWLICFVAPCAEHLRVVLPVLTVLMVTVVAMTGRVAATLLNGARVERCSHGIETPHTQQDFVGHVTVIGLDDAQTVEVLVEPGPNLADLLGTSEVHLIENQHVRKSDLSQLEVQQRWVLRVRENLIRVYYADDAVEPDAVPQDVFNGLGARQQGDNRLDQVVPNLAAHAAVSQADHVIVHAHDEFGVDVDRAKVVDQDANTQTVIPSQDAIQQRGLSCPEKASQNRDGNGLSVVVDDFHGLSIPLRTSAQKKNPIMQNINPGVPPRQPPRD